MPRIDDLPADQKATLQLLLTQGKSYEELAGLLRLDPPAVRERALNALDALGPDTPAGLTAARQDELSDYLLGQQSASGRAATREYLDDSAAGRSWARAVATELRAFNGADVPEIPADGRESDEAFEALEARRAARSDQERSSRLGGILLIAGIGIAVAVLLVILLKPGGDDSSDDTASNASGDTAAQTTGATGAAGDTQILGQANLSAQDGSKSAAVAFVFRSKGHNVLGIRGANFTPWKREGPYYAVWVTGSGGANATRLGFVTTEVPSSGENKGALLTGADPSGLPSKTATEKRVKQQLTTQLDNIFDTPNVLVTRETQRDPQQPSKQVVVSGELQEGSANITGSGGTG